MQKLNLPFSKPSMGSCFILSSAMLFWVGVVASLDKAVSVEDWLSLSHNSQTSFTISKLFMKITHFNTNGIFGTILKLSIAVILGYDRSKILTENENNWILSYPAGVAGVLGELVLDWGAESVLESGRGLCLSMVFKPQTGFFTGLNKRCRSGLKQDLHKN